MAILDVGVAIPDLGVICLDVCICTCVVVAFVHGVKGLIAKPCMTCDVIHSCHVKVI